MSTSTAVIQAGTAGEGIEAAIRREHEAASSAALTALDHALECGRLLAQAREGIPHGGWESFVRERCGIPTRTARMYLRLDANRERLANRQHVAGLTVREAVRELTVPRVEAEPVAAVREAALVEAATALPKQPTREQVEQSRQGLKARQTELARAKRYMNSHLQRKLTLLLLDIRKAVELLEKNTSKQSNRRKAIADELRRLADILMVARQGAPA